MAVTLKQHLTGHVRAGHIDPELMNVIESVARACVRIGVDVGRGALGGVHGLAGTGNVHGEVGQVIAGLKPGRVQGDDIIVFWHRGFAVSDVVLGNFIYERAVTENVGMIFPLLSAGEE